MLHNALQVAAPVAGGAPGAALMWHSASISELFVSYDATKDIYEFDFFNVIPAVAVALTTAGLYSKSEEISRTVVGS